MPWTRQQVKYLLSKGSPLKPSQKTKMVGELHADPSMGHKKKGSKALKKPRATKRDVESHVHGNY
jgi:hypothetical protein